MENKFFPLKISKNNKDYLESIISKISIYSNKINIPKNFNEICFIQKCIELLDVLHFGISTKTPLILEGLPDQGKQTMIKFLADFLNFELININISSQTTNEDLLTKIIIDKDEQGDICIKNSETKLLSAIKNYQNNPNTIVVFQNLNHASPAVMETISSIFGNINSNILLPDGSTIKRENSYNLSYLCKHNDTLMNLAITNSEKYVELARSSNIKEKIPLVKFKNGLKSKIAKVLPADERPEQEVKRIALPEYMTLEEIRNLSSEELKSLI